MHSYNEKLKIVVITEDLKDCQKYFNLFKVLFSDSIQEMRDTKNAKNISTIKAEIRFLIRSESVRGTKAHFVLNLTQDEEFHMTRAMTMTTPHSRLKEIERWSELFTNL